MKKVKIVLILIACIITFITIYKIRDTYAIFESNVISTKILNVGKWKINVNNQDIVSSATHTFTIEDINIQGNANTKSGKFAPGMSGSFDIEIEPQDTEVSIRYDILVDDSLLDDSQIVIGTIAETNNSNTLTRTGENTYTGLILLNDITANYYDNIHITFIWDNDEANNEKDSIIGTTLNGSISVPITITFTQYMGETIDEYSDGEPI